MLYTFTPPTKGQSHPSPMIQEGRVALYPYFMDFREFPVSQTFSHVYMNLYVYIYIYICPISCLDLEDPVWLPSLGMCESYRRNTGFSEIIICKPFLLVMDILYICNIHLKMLERVSFY